MDLKVACAACQIVQLENVTCHLLGVAEASREFGRGAINKAQRSFKVQK